MADPKAQKSFDAFIQEARKKRKAEALASQILGKNRRSSTPLSNSARSSPSASLASRMGVSKRPSSTTPQGHRPNNLASRIGNTTIPSRKTDRFAAAALKASLPAREAEISIRGAAGPYTVIAQNFALGTTAADIESVMTNTGGPMVSCRLTAANPTVIAEMKFVKREGAERVIAQFNNKKADGQLLYVYFAAVNPRAKTVVREEVVVPEPEPELVVEQERELVPGDLIMDVDDGAGVGGYVEEQHQQQEQQLLVETQPYRDDRLRPGYARSSRGRGGGDRGGYRDGYARDQRRDQQQPFQDERFGGYGGGPRGPRYGGRDDRRGGYGGQGRMYSDGMMQDRRYR